MSRNALVVGINIYQWDNLKPLPTAPRDAEAIAGRLQQEGNFHVTRLPEFFDPLENSERRMAQHGEVTLENLETALVNLFMPEGESIPDTALFYFSGHGLRKQRGLRDGFLATSDTQPALGNWGLRLKWLRELLEQSPIKQQVVWLDCCYSAELLNFAEADPGANRKARDYCFMAASQEFESVISIEGKSHSTFTQAILRGFDAAALSNQWVTNETLVTFLQQTLKVAPQQFVPSNKGVIHLITRPEDGTEIEEPPPRQVFTWVPRQMPPLPTHFVERPEHQDAVKTKLLCSDARVKGTLVVSAIYGLGGIGKSVLAAKLAHDDEVQAHFCDGILWVTLGQNPDLLPLLGEWVQALQDHDYQPITVEGTASHLRTLLYDKKMLLVVDDVWSPDHLEPFRVGGSDCCVLVTTRRATITNADYHPLEVMTPGEALELLTQKLPKLSESGQQRAMQFAERVGYLPLALELAAAQVEDGVSWQDLLADFGEEVARLETLDTRQAADITEEEKRRNDSLLACFNLSLRVLAPEQLRQFTELGVLPEDVAVGAVMAATLWNVTPRQAGATLCQLRNKALLLPGPSQLDDEGNECSTYRMHDLMHDLAKWLLCQDEQPAKPGDLPGLGLTVPDAHRRLLGRYRTKTQGGLWHTLTDDGYIYAQLTWHMEQANDADAVHHLLQEETPRGGNGWFEACDALGKPGIFINDVGRAWRLAEANADDNLSEAIPRIWRYALIRASLNSLVQNIPPELIATLVKAGLWQPAHGLAYVQQAQTSDQRAQIIVQLAALLPQRLFPEALALTCQMQNHNHCASALCALVPQLPEELLEEALGIVHQMQSDSSRISVLHVLAPQLPERLLEEALGIVHQMQSDSSRISVLRVLAPQLPERLLEEALGIARQIQFDYDRAAALCVLAPRLPELWGEALAVTRQFQDDSSRTSALRALAPQLPEGLLEEALGVARQIQDDYDRDSALSALVPQLPEGLLEEALGVACQIQNDSYRADALHALAPRLPEEFLEEALRVTRQIQSEFPRAYVLSALAPQLPELWEEALGIVRQIRNDSSRASALHALAPQLPERFLEEALGIAYQIRDDSSRANALRVFLPQLSEQLLEEALGITRQIRDDLSRASDLRALAPQLPERLLEEALGITCQIQSDLSRATALSALAPRLPERLLEDALGITRQIRDDLSRTKALRALAPRLPERLLADALGIARQIPSDLYRISALHALAPRLPERLLADALEDIRQIQDESSRAYVLSALVPPLPEGLLLESLRIARQIQDESSRADALRALAPQLPELWEEALAVTRQIQDEASRASALRALAPQLPELWEEALAVTRQIQDEASRASALRALAPHLPELWEEALAATCQIRSESSRTTALSALAPQLPERLLEEALAVTRQIRSRSYRVSALCALAPQLPELWEEALAVTRQIQDEFSRASALRALAPRLPELWEEALAVTRQIQDESSRTTALSALAPQLPERLLEEALAVICQIPYGGCRATALSALAPRLPERLLEEALRIAYQIPYDYDRASALNALAPYLPEWLLDDALVAVWLFQERYHQAKALSGFLERLPLLGQGFSFWVRVMDVLAYRNRKELVGYLPRLRPFLLTLVDDDTLRRMVQVMGEVSRQWP